MNDRSAGPRELLLPKEHGSWSLAFEPVALGLLVAPSWAGGALALAAAAGFFLRRPLKLALTLPDNDPRRAAARPWVAILLLAAVTGLAGAALALRTAWLVTGLRPDWPAKRVGILEAVLGVAMLVVLTVAY